MHDGGGLRGQDAAGGGAGGAHLLQLLVQHGVTTAKTARTIIHRRH